ncbi:DUF1206 domain-containing protein [Roseomonas marmotae]|uniref:DUF1206 domain-containing protein n=1 Tax=Roseomonas marmotae TaxID=2768161 RepID=A0ABS3K8Z9_9PROT|nr:DUF1206 domain-containing protein [Roseomonas marmotae]MBO1073944.1 DUF1206 domain-containing protein [Roseomonas marmotae]QTI78444.1 DUF1206 domain-containing protein [Roseomonas marmotae]
MPSHRHALELLARLGYAARGVVNLIIGLLAFLAALGQGGQTTGSKGALLSLLSHPFGGVLLGVVALGLFGFALWRGCQSLLDADSKGRGAKAMVVRAGQMISAFTYAGLGIFAAALIIGRAVGSTDDAQQAQDWSRWLMAHPFGEVLVALAGLVVAGVGVGMLVRARKASFTRHLECPEPAGSWVVKLGRIGFSARGVVFLIIGAFLVIAAWQSDPEEVRGLSGALRALQGQPFGRVLFGIVALGLAAFGIFEFAEARYRRIRAPG